MWRAYLKDIIMTDLVSIIIPVYNAEKTIQKCVDSVTNQTYKYLQIILVDDGSTDESRYLCENLSGIDSRIMLIEKQNGGVSSARNQGLEYATGKFIMFLDSDDWLENDIIETYVKLIHAYNTDIVIGGLLVRDINDIYLYTKNIPLIGFRSDDLLNSICEDSEMFGYAGGKLFVKDIITANNIRFNENMHSQEDLDFCLSYYEKASTFYLTDYTGYNYRSLPGKRTPPYCDFIRNQLKLLSIAENRAKLSETAYKNINKRICGYVYMMFYQSNTEEKVFDAILSLRKIRGLNEYLHRCKPSGEIKYIVYRYLKNDYTGIYRYFCARNFIKKLVKRK